MAGDDDRGEGPGRILFWARSPGHRPWDFIRRDVPRGARQIVATILSSGRDLHPDLHAMGWADCRICGRRLGTRDLGGLGLAWPELAEHYVLEHGVWTPGCSELLSRAVALLGRPIFSVEDHAGDDAGDAGNNVDDDRGESASRILFWGRAPGVRPQDFVRDDVPDPARQILAAVLSSGREVACWKGSADCRVCGLTLGIRDLGSLGLVWPELAEHYVLEHGVWTPGCSELLRRVAGLVGRSAGAGDLLCPRPGSRQGWDVGSRFHGQESSDAVAGRVSTREQRALASSAER